MSYFLAFAGFALLIIIHELGHFAAAKAVGMRVERFALFFPPLLARVRRGETEYAIGAVPLGGYVKISGMSPTEDVPAEAASRSYHNQPVWKRVVVIGAGPAANVLAAFAVLFSLWMFAAPKPTSVVDRVEAGWPAAGKLQPRDRILTIDGRGGGPDDFRKRVEGHACPGSAIDKCLAATPALLEVDRGGRPTTLRIRPIFDSRADPPRMRLGFTYAVTRGYGPAAAARHSVANIWQVSAQTVSAIVRIFNPAKRKQLSGVVGAYEATRQSVADSAVDALQVLALISLSLALVNLFPFLPLDGGHIFFSLLEKVRGKPISFEAMQRASVPGFMLIVMLFVIVLTNDIGRLTSGGFHVR